jgi:hypothetical protein
VLTGNSANIIRREYMVWVVNARIVEGYKVEIKFNDGADGIIDFQNIIKNDKREIIKELLDKNKFQTVKVEYDTLVWENGVDFAPEYLYEKINQPKNLLRRGGRAVGVWLFS